MKILNHSAFVLLSTFSIWASAAPFTYQYQSQVDGASIGSYAARAGESVLINVILDNGGNDHRSQTWGLADVVRVGYIVNGNPFLTVDPNAAGQAVNFTGMYQSDASGELTSVPSIFHSFLTTQDAVIVATLGGNLFDYRIDNPPGATDITGFLFASSPISTVASNWRFVLSAGPQQVPALPIGLLGLLGITMLGIGAKLQSRKV